LRACVEPPDRKLTSKRLLRKRGPLIRGAAVRTQWALALGACEGQVSDGADIGAS